MGRKVTADRVDARVEAAVAVEVVAEAAVVVAEAVPETARSKPPRHVYAMMSRLITCIVLLSPYLTGCLQ